MRWRAAEPTANKVFLPAGKPVVLGIDPGLACTGWGLVRHPAAAAFVYIAAGIVRSPASEPTAIRLAGIFSAIEEICGKHQPDAAVIERVFVNQNPTTSMSLGQARGAALAALGKSSLPCLEIAPRTVKRNLTGDSRASKRSVAAAVRSILELPSSLKLAIDASDALAIALGYRAVSLRLRPRRR